MRLLGINHHQGKSTSQMVTLGDKPASYRLDLGEPFPVFCFECSCVKGCGKLPQQCEDMLMKCLRRFLPALAKADSRELLFAFFLPLFSQCFQICPKLLCLRCELIPQRDMNRLYSAATILVEA